MLSSLFLVFLPLFPMVLADDPIDQSFGAHQTNLDMARQIKEASSDTANFDFVPDFMSSLIPIKPIDPKHAIDQFRRYAKILNFLIDKKTGQTNVSKQCVQDLKFYVDSQLLFIGAMIQECQNGSATYENCRESKKEVVQNNIWVLYVADAFGKLESGLLGGNRAWWGSFKGCRDIVELKMPKSKIFKWEYFLGTKDVLLDIFGPDAKVPLQIGLCFPASCSASDMTSLFKMVAEEVSLSENQTIFDNIVSRKNAKISDHPDTIGAIAFCAIWLTILLLATAYDYFVVRRTFIKESSADKEITLSKNAKARGRLEMLALSFSILSNGEKILSMKKNTKTIGCLHGMRFLTMCWIILGHTYFFAIIGQADNLVSTYETIVKDFTICTIANATLSVDTFFLLSAFLVAYLWFIETEKQNGQNVKKVTHWVLFWLHRYLRLTPVLALFIFVETTLSGFLTTGPLWNQAKPYADNCKRTWWTVLLYIQNFYKVSQCEGHTWYLALDMQFYILSPILLVLLFKKPVVGLGVAGFALLMTIVGTGVETGLHDYRPNAWFGGNFTGNSDIYFHAVYIKPQYRWGPYVVGLLLGYFMYRFRSKKVVMSYRVKWSLRFLTLGMNYVLVYGVYEYINGSKKMHPVVNGFYSGTSRVLWATNLAYIIFECMTGNGGIIDRILSLRIWLPFSRLTYCAYLVHPGIMVLWYVGRDLPFHFDSHYGMVYAFIAHCAMSYVAALVLSLAFEAPFMGIEKIVFGSFRKKEEKELTPVAEIGNHDDGQPTGNDTGGTYRGGDQGRGAEVGITGGRSNDGRSQSASMEVDPDDGSENKLTGSSETEKV